MNETSLTLVTGASRSGKSEWAEKLASESGQSVVYVATADVSADDPEWQARIEQHRQRRPATWETIAAPLELVPIIRSATSSECLLIDSLGTWLANHLAQDDRDWQAITQELLANLQQAPCSIIIVAEETGWGVVPAYPLGRQFRDRLGRLTRQIAAISKPVYLVIAGYALDLSYLGVPIDQTPDS
ncbi:MAG TPA: bifunctional adenosylcobinamide kinase/adenosylcobinamide-phosphate guanylyltransferase [Leptolyngbyaceae cyanobacterium M33_DOE_097]|uniref:Adenosylcobinamide kinase n=1 Tax=Oscillatoriales cyanobacterium SpSt-418 TaxID=2282169 RepID=A0A7C3PJ92_9CYAN|nr:bifunctional adenosylcobinamide kinase/adenosylcobinamide-phosphate guanylyltransferase [Leptolyngbyaceae cyanobacterium M33_DOE_097]